MRLEQEIHEEYQTHANDCVLAIRTSGAPPLTGCYSGITSCPDSLLTSVDLMQLVKLLDGSCFMVDS